MTQNFLKSRFWLKFKYIAGYCLFASAILYGLWSAPSQTWEVRPMWLFASAVVAFLMFCIQTWQVMVFLDYHNIRANFMLPVLFTARKTVLNTILPAKSGTIALLPMLTENYEIKWHDFIKFILIGSVASLLISLLSAIWLFLPIMYTVALLFSALVVMIVSMRYKLFFYSSCFPMLLLIAALLFLSTIISFYCLIKGLGYHLSLIDISYFAVALNALAQASLTPGNVGVREVVVGFIAPYLSLPISIGVLSSAIFYFIRLLVYSIILVITEWWYKQYEFKQITRNS